MRILSLPSYRNPVPPGAAAQRLGQAAADASHEFWPDSESVLDPGIAVQAVAGAAAKHLVTFA